MIFSSIYSDSYIEYPEALNKAIQYLKNNDFTSMKTGVYEIQGKDIYAQVFDVDTAPLEEKYPEVHEKYIDVQFLAYGKEKLGFAIDNGKYEIDKKIEERDLIFYKSVDNESFIEATEGCYCIFFPNDIHRPAICLDKPMTIRKVVVKVKLSLL